MFEDARASSEWEDNEGWTLEEPLFTWNELMEMTLVF